MNYDEIIKFWFEELSPKQWWLKDEALDQFIFKKFAHIHAKAMKCECFEWRKVPYGALAEIIILDQFTRNMYRNSPLSYSNDPLAQALSQVAIDKGFHNEYNANEKKFLILPLMHSESLLLHLQAVQIVGMDEKDAKEHREVIQKFGRFPHRNKILGRASTAEEIIFLKDNPGW